MKVLDKCCTFFVQSRSDKDGCRCRLRTAPPVEEVDNTIRVSIRKVKQTKTTIVNKYIYVIYT